MSAIGHQQQQQSAAAWVLHEEVYPEMYVVLAEFDVDKGSIVRLQLPRDVPVAEHDRSLLPDSPFHDAEHGSSWSSYLADQLLPDGTEHYDFAVSWFVLNRPEVTRRWSCVASMYHPSGSDWVCDTPFCCVAVNRDNVLITDCKGEQKSVHMAIRGLSFHPIPTLPKGCYDLFAPPGSPQETLENGDITDLSTDERPGDTRDVHVFVMLQQGECSSAILFHSETDFEAFSARVASNNADCMAIEHQSRCRTPTGAVGGQSSSPLYGVCCTMTRKDPSVRRGSVNKGVALISTSIACLPSLVPALQSALEVCCRVTGWNPTTEEAQRSLLSLLLSRITKDFFPKFRELTINRHAAGIGGALIADGDESDIAHVPFDRAELDAFLPASPTAASELSRKPLKLIARPAVHHAHISTVLHSPVTLELIDSLGATDMLKVFLAVLADRRVMFIARHLVATRISNACLSVGLILEGVFPNFLVQRVFPYCGITSTAHLEARQGYVFGTLNPIFEGNRPKRWWDLSVDLEKKALQSADPEIEALWEALADTLATSARRVTLIIGRAKALCKADHPSVERNVRMEVKFFLENCLTAAALDPSAAQRCRTLLGSEVAQYASIEIARRKSVRQWATELTDASTAGHWSTLVSVLQRGLRCSATSEGLLTLLNQFPEWEGGLLPLGELLFHPDPTVVLLTVALFRRIDADPVGRRCVSRLNSFVLFAFEQLKLELPDTDL